MQDLDLPPSDIPVFRNRDAVVAKFRLPVHAENFHDTGPIRGNLIVFPRTSVAITRQHSTVHADPNVIMFYNRGEEYRRDPISSRGDQCDYIHFSASLLREAIQVHDPGARDREQPFDWSHTLCDSRTYLLQRQLLRRLEEIGSVGVDQDLEIGETLFEILAGCLRTRFQAGGLRSGMPGRKTTLEAHREMVQRLLHHLSESYRSTESLEELASVCDHSPFQMCRVFRQQTGMSIHQYRNRLRMHCALEMLEDRRQDVTAVALDLGFSSHSHFTAAFGKVFGVTPTQFQARAGR